MGRVAGKIALVSGAAGGIGSACARKLAAEGASVVLVDVNEDMGEEVLAQIKSEGGTGYYANLDVTNEDSWASLMDKIQDLYGGSCLFRQRRQWRNGSTSLE
jgi:NAD(P)-dependent dehydrogenase (short-subunit alcohol dehydrogenase family)